MCRETSGVVGAHTRRGLTFIELMISLTVTTILVASLSVLASTVRTTAEFNNGQNDALQHARVMLDRVERMVGEAYAVEQYPGVVVMDETVSSHRYPDTLLIWHPTGAPVNAAGPPLVREIVIICPNPTNAGELIEVTAPADTRTVQLTSSWINTNSGRSFINGIKTSSSSTKTQLTPLMRSALASNSSNAQPRGCVRFECELHPTESEMTAFRSGSGTWENLAWPQNTYSATFGLRQVWLRTELQLLSEPRAADGTVPASAVPLPFLGSATMYYTIAK